MSRYAKALQRLLTGTADQTIRYDVLCSLLGRLGFAERQRGGSHRIFSRDGVLEILNLQPRRTGQPNRTRSGRSAMLSCDTGWPIPFSASPTMPDYRYEIIIYWSEPDQAFVAEVPELPGCAADGPTYGVALAQAEGLDAHAQSILLRQVGG